MVSCWNTTYENIAGKLNMTRIGPDYFAIKEQWSPGVQGLQHIRRTYRSLYGRVLGDQLVQPPP